MKKFGFAHRALAMLLVLVMTLQLLPLGVLATFADLKAADPGVTISSLKQDDTINWPIKVYDYLSDGMLFEWMDTNTTTNSSNPKLSIGHSDGTSEVTPYGGGYKNPVTELGVDFTYDDSSNYAWNTSSSYSPLYHWKYNHYGVSYKLDKVDAVDFRTPMHLHVTDNTSNGHNVMISKFSSDESTAGNIRYMVMVYRAYKVEDYYFSISFTDDTNGTNTWSRNKYTLQDSTDWTYVIIDTKALAGTLTDIQYIWLTWHTTASFSNTSNTTYRGMVSGAYCDFTHIGYFSDLTEATNYGEEAVKFDNEPGEYLHHQVTTNTTVTTVKPAARLDYIFSLNYRWKTEGVKPAMYPNDSSADYPNVRYGMDFTTHSTDNGWKTNAYTSDTYWTWANGTSQTYKYTDDTYAYTYEVTFPMTAIGVKEMTQTNGAQYVRLTTTGPSKILLSKFREDHAAQYEGYVPLTSDVNYMVLVYRPNGLDSSYKYGLWAQGYDDEYQTDSHKGSDRWKFAALTKTTDWTTDSAINQLSFSDTEGWQYVVIPLMETISANDSDMLSITRTARTGLYLPTLSDGKSLDIAYVAYFRAASDGVEDELDEAKAFGQAAVDYMNAAADTTVTTGTKTLSASRTWYGGGNKSFGMLYSSGGGQYLISGNSGGESASTDQHDYGYEFDTWMIGYRTNATSSNSFNTARYNLVYNESTGRYDKVKYTANYTGTTSGYDNLDFISNPTGTTNKIYFLAATEDDETWGSNDGDDDNGHDFDTSNMDFDGYTLLQTMMEGVMTVGLLEGSLQTVTVNKASYRVPVYRQEVVEYIAYNLLYGLRVPQKDRSGNYNTRFIKGTKSTQYGGVDLNGDGVIGWIDYDGDSRSGHYNESGTWVTATELNEESVDLATALRHELGMSFRLNNSVAVITVDGEASDSHETLLTKMGSYEETLAKSKQLYGEFSDCRNSIDTAMDAAYYLLNNIFISNSYNQKQDDYDYLTLSSATVTSSGRTGTAYVFDAGFTTGLIGENTTDVFEDDGTNKSAVKYDPYVDGGTGSGTISMEGVTGKTLFDYGKSTVSWTTRFPFLPVTDAEGDYAGQTQSYYFLDDAQRIYTEGSNSYKDRNFNYVLASNGEFVYREEDALFFEFQGDDDVYLFINGELVLDIGGAHSITSVYIDVNDYVDAAAEALKALSTYGYHKDMSISEFDEWISADTIAYLDANGDPTGKTATNSFTADQIAEFKRQHRLNLSDGQICQFDFYYMERHGWGANMRILTNMHITDPDLSVDKKAYQFGEEVEYGGVVDASSSIEYSFKLSNTGNTKLYNLSWRDDVLGITMDPSTGLTVSEDLNGIYVRNAGGGRLQAKDLTAIVSGEDVDGNYVEVTVTFPEEDGDGGQQAFKNFLETLAAEGTESGLDDAEVTKAGSGLWVDASVEFRGIYYILTPEKTEAGMLDNTVYLTATTKRYSTTAGNRTLRSDASHRIYTNGFPIHYQWAGHNIFMNLAHLLEEAKIEAEVAGSQLSLYQEFFKNVDSMDEIKTAICDKYGRVGIDHPYQTAYSDGAGHSGYLINYDAPGVYVFYLLMYKDSYADDINASDIEDGDYAILRSQVFVADVKDSVYVLDYGISTESLDVDGELFDGDYLFGSYGTIRSKLMGVTGTQPSFIDPEKNTDATKTGITFAAQDLETSNNVFTPDGIFKVNLAIPSDGKNIAYNSITGEYTLTGVGTVTLNAVVPTDGNWTEPHLYYWYDDGTTGPAWPGTPMTDLGAGKFKVDIPADVNNVIINNGSGALQTKDLEITAGLESTITVTVTDDNVVDAKIETVVGEYTLHATKPDSWSKLYLYYWNDNEDEGAPWPGEELTADSIDENGYYTYELPSDTSYVILNDGGTKRTVEKVVTGEDGTETTEKVTVTDYNQTGNLDIYAGMEVWIEADDTVLDSYEGTDGATISYYNSLIRYTLSKTDTYTVHVSVPGGWNDTVNLYYWRSGATSDQTWPGTPMGEVGDFGWYTLEVPGDIVDFVVNDAAVDENGNVTGHYQTVNLTVSPGLETWIMVRNAANADGKYTADIAYGSESSSAGLTFTPTDFMDSDVNNLWMALTVHSTSANPTALNSNIDIHNEVQMYKKITVLPATVVYYEDDFAGIKYNESGSNTFTYYGDGSGLLSQSVDQSQNYGQDATYQDSSNNIYSGDSETVVKINAKETIATFTFKGTGFELISRTDAETSGTTVAYVYDAEEYAEYASGTVTAKPDTITHQYVITQYDHGNDGGSESIDQVPTVRIKDLPYGEYTVELSAIPSYTYCGTPISSKVTVAGDCYTGSQILRTCTGCGDTWKTTAVASHSYATTVVEATCTERGYTLYTCADCGKVYADNEVQALGHNYVDGVCTNCGDGATKDTVSIYFQNNWLWSDICIYYWGSTTAENPEWAGNAMSLYGNDGTYDIYVAEVPADITGLIINGSKNDGSGTDKTPNIESGWYDGICYSMTWNDGNQVETASIDDVLPTVDPDTPTVDPATCSHYYLSDVCVLCGTENACTHVYTKETKDPTCVDMGYTKYTCSECGYSYTEDVAALGHSYSGSKCASCGEDRVSDYHYERKATKDSHVYIDGLRIYQPLDATNAAYSASENGATFMELRDLIINGQVAVATLSDTSLRVSSGTTTWTENLAGGDFDDADLKSYVAVQVESSDDYLIQGPNNEVYMEGTVSNSALAFYVMETDGDNHELQIAARALDYDEFYGTGTSALNVQLQYGILNSGSFEWKNLTRVVSGTEQYYTIPYTECPRDNTGRYQIVIRAVNGETDIPAMVSYSNLKMLGLEIEEVEGVGESSILYYLNGLLVQPTYYLAGTINGVTYDKSTDVTAEDCQIPTFVDNELTMTFNEASTITGIRRDMGGKTVLYNVTVDIPAGSDVTFKVAQTKNDVLDLDYCIHTWDEGVVTREPNCTDYGVRTLTCTQCGHTKNVPIDTNGVHSYSGGICTRCGDEEPKFYLIGYINGANYGCDEDSANTGDYLFVDGQVVASFTQDSYVYVKNVKDDGSTVWYMTEGYNEALKSTTLYDTTTGITDPNKMFVAAGEDYTFTLVRNSDGSTVTLSYELPCAHQWGDGEVTTEPTCEKAGIRTYTCSLCSKTKTETIAALGHNYEDGYCTNSNCSQEDPNYYITLYFKDTGSWENVCIYTWDGMDIKYSDAWPGAQMDVVDKENGVYSYTVSKHATRVIFNNGSAEKQTDNLTIPTDGKDYYIDGTWSVYGCDHNYEAVVTPPTCTADGYTTYTCTNCGSSYTGDVVTASGSHSYVDGACSVCGALEGLYFMPNNNWTQSGAWFAAYFYNDSGNTWVAMESYGETGYYKCDIPDGYANNNVIFCRMNPASDTLDWSNKWSQTSDLNLTEGNCYTYEEGGWDYGSGTWSILTSTSTATVASEEIEVNETTVNAVISEAATDGTFSSSAFALNLNTIKAQMAATTVYGVDDGELDDSIGDTEEPEFTEQPTILPIGASLAFKDEIYYNVYFQVSNPDDVEIAEMGLVTWTSDVDGTVSNGEYVLTGAVLEGENYKARSQAISAKNMGEELYFKVYLKLADGSYVYTDLLNYSAKTYATNKLNAADSSDSLKALCVALMNYGAAAQEFFSYKTDDLMNAGLTEAQKALVNGYSADMIADVVSATSAKIGGLSATGGFSSMYPSVNFGGAFGINYIFTPNYEVDGEMKLYVWTAEDYAAAEVLTLENASQVLTMTGNSSGVYTARVTGIAAKNVGDTVYVCGVYESDGVTYRTGVLSYSVGKYCQTMAARTDSVKALAEATGVYTYYAKLHLLGE